jgi:hypothetical protein
MDHPIATALLFAALFFLTIGLLLHQYEVAAFLSLVVGGVCYLARKRGGS